MDIKRALIIKIVLLFAFNSLAFAEDRGIVLFSEALSLYKTLTEEPSKAEKVDIWDTIARAFYSVYISYPNSPKAPNALFLSAKMYEEMGERFKSKEYFDKSIDYSKEFVSKFPKNNLADDAQIRAARLTERYSKTDAYIEYQTAIEFFPYGDMTHIAKNKIAELSPFKPDDETLSKIKNSKRNDKLIKVSKIRHWSTENNTRVVIHLDKEMPFKPYFLKEDSINDKPSRLFVDIIGAIVDKNLEVEPIESGLLEQIKFARNTHDIVRVVLYMKSFDNYRVFSLDNPFRIVMDIEGVNNLANSSYAKSDKSGREEIKQEIPYDVSGLRQALGLKIKTVVIDPGHGGHDPGAIGPTGLKEKNVNLQIAKALKTKLERDGKKFGIERVYLTRSSDIFIPLEERTAIAKKQYADLFISIHCNAAKNKRTTGIETYILSFTNDKHSLSVAARENATTKKRLNELRDIIKKYVLNSKIEESNKFASYVQTEVVSNVSHKYSSINNKGVKKAPFIVLIGADIPSILVETSFITNPKDEKRLKDKNYIDYIAEGIFVGVKRYSTEVQTASIDY